MANLDQSDPYGYEADLEESIVATGILGAIRELVERKQWQIHKRMVDAYRSKQTEHDMLVGCVAELKALDDLIVECEAMQTRGNVAAERMQRNA